MHEDTMRTVQITKTYSDFADASHGKTIEIYTIPNDRMEVHTAYMDVTALFSGGQASSVTCEVGTLDDPTCNQILAVQDVQTSTKKPYWGTYWNNVNPQFIILDSGDKIYARLEADVNTNDLTTGSVTFVITLFQH